MVSNRNSRRKAGRVTTLIGAVAATAVLAAAPPSQATVFYAREELFELAFPDADEVKPRDFFITAEQRAAIQQRASSHLESDLVTVYVGLKDGKPIGYAMVDTHIVRTLPETYLIVLALDGSVTATHVIAFYEPLEYLPTERWLTRLDGAVLSPELRIGRAVAGITGSTLSTRAVIGGIRRALAVHAVLLAKAH